MMHSPGSHWQPQMQQQGYYEITCFPETSHIDTIPLAPPLPVTAVSVDPMEELLWIGNAEGRIRSYFVQAQSFCRASPEIYVPLLHTSFLAHSWEEVLQISPVPSGLYSFSHDVIRFHSRGGVPRLTYSSPHTKGMTSFGVLNATKVAFGRSERLNDSRHKTGEDEEKLVGEMGVSFFDAEKSMVVQTVLSRAGGGVSCLELAPGFIFAGLDNGNIEVLELGTRDVVEIIGTHLNSITEMSFSGNQLAVSGTTFYHGSYTIDNVVLLFDVRSHGQTDRREPILSHGFPVSVQFLNRTQNAVSIACSDGVFTIFDTSASTPTPVFQHQLSLGGHNVLCHGIAATDEVVAIGDEGGGIHILSNKRIDESMLNDVSAPTERPYPLPPRSDPIISSEGLDNAEISIMPMIYHGKSLLSSWEKLGRASMCRVGEVVEIPPEILANMTMVDFVGHAHVQPRKKTDSDEAKNDIREESGISLSSGQYETPLEIPWKRIEFRKDQHGLNSKVKRVLEHNDKYPGLENVLPNSYTNALLQVLFHVPPLRKFYVHEHLCRHAQCLSCELCFFFHLLSPDADGEFKSQHVQTTNLLRQFQKNATASALGIVEQPPVGSGGAKLATMAGASMNFFLRTLNSEAGKRGEEISIVASLFKFGTRVETRCETCMHSAQVDSEAFTATIDYSTAIAAGESGIMSVTLEALIQQALSSTMPVRSYCSECKSYTSSEQDKRATGLPKILIVDCTTHTQESTNLWRVHSLKGVERRSTGRTNAQQKPWVSDTIFIGEVKRESASSSSAGFTVSSEDFSDNSNPYELVAMVVHVSDKDEESGKGSHLAALIRMREEGDGEMGNYMKKWYIFNDFCVRDVTDKSPFDFSMRWKFPVMLVYAQTDAWDPAEDVPQQEVTDQFSEKLKKIVNEFYKATPPSAEFVVPGPEEKIETVAVDAEFYLESGEFVEIMDDGTEVTTKNSALGLGRVTALRVGEKEGVPIIDDYVQAQNVVDYLTRFSGLEPGDLNPSTSPHHVVPLKTVYLKLRALIDSGVVFIGHGLDQDFRVMNINVPRSQVIDTVRLFKLSGRRNISLRFLYSYFFSSQIQEDTHDSKEDALAAMRIFQRYKQLSQAGNFNDILEDIYDLGNLCQWDPKKISSFKVQE